MYKILVFISASALIFSIAGCHSNNSQTGERAEAPSATAMSQPNEKTEQEPIAVSDLQAEFGKDRDGASKTYEGKRITVTGTVVKTGPDPHQKPGIELGASEDAETFVLCVCDSFDQLDGISPGDVLTVSGNFIAFWREQWVVLKQSEVHSR